MNSLASDESVEGHKLLDSTRVGAHISYTNQQWRVEAGYENHPAVRVSWYGARDFCAQVGARFDPFGEGIRKLELI